MDVVKVALKVHFVPNDMIPESFLPEFHRAFNPDESFVLLGEIWLERVHDVAEIALSCRADEQMKMLRQEDISQRCERMKSLHVVERVTQ